MRAMGLVTAAAMLLLAATGARGAEGAGEPTEVRSAISAVTVYLDRALVTRTADVRCARGENAFVFAGLPAELTDGSIRVSASGATVRGVRVERVFLERAAEADVRQLEDDLRDLQDEEAALRDEINVLVGEARFLRTLQATTAERTNRILAEGELKLPTVEGCRGLLNFITSGLSANAKKARAVNVKLRDLRPKITAKHRELNEKRSGERLENKKITVVLESARGGAASVKLAYLLPGAMWFPAYDVRADAGRGEAELVYYAIIQQATGEEWTNAALTLSASRPSERTSKPKLSPWLLGGAPLPAMPAGMSGANRPDFEGNEDGWAFVNPAVQIRKQYGRRGKAMQKAHFNLLGNLSQVERVFLTVTARGTSVVFPVPTRETVRTDGKPHRVVLSVAQLKLTTEYSVVPAMSLATYVTGKAVNTTKLPLLPGEASVYLGGDLIGASRVRFVAPGEETDFYLGVDETIKVTRQLDAKKSSIRSSGKRLKVEAAYSIIVENFRKKPVTVTVEEALPVSQDKSIYVRIRKLEPEPAESKRGLNKWKLELPAGEKRTVNIAFSIDRPIPQPKSPAASAARARRAYGGSGQAMPAATPAADMQLEQTMEWIRNF